MTAAALPPYPPFCQRSDAKARIKSALTAVRAILDADLLAVHSKELLSVCLWKLSEAEGSHKYDTRYVSVSSLGRPIAELAHEHVNERAHLIADLMERRIAVDQLVQLCIGCTVLRTEHSTLTALRSDAIGWDRYREARIAVIDRLGGSWCVPPQSAAI